jgi:hypothetical protein
MYNIHEVSEIENSLIKTAPLCYGKYFNNAIDLISLTSNFYSKKINPEYWLFVFFTNLLYNSLFLSLLSTLRRHDVQSNMMIRQALEAIALTCYSAYNKDPEKFAHFSADGSLYLDSDDRKKMYDWFKANYEEESSRIKYFKDIINDSTSHANLLITFNNSEISNSTIKTSIFDGSNENIGQDIIIKQRLWWIGNISFGTINLFSKIISELNIAELINGLPEIMKRLGEDNKELMEELKQEPIFQKYEEYL